MKNFKHYFYALLFITAATFTSCSDDDDNSDDGVILTDDTSDDVTPTDDDGSVDLLTGAIMLNGETLSIDEAFADDYNLDSGNEGTYNVDFSFTGTTEGGEDFRFYVETFSAGTSFTPGDFVYQDGADLTDAPDQFFNNFIFSANPTLIVGDTSYLATGGTINVTGEQPNYVIEIDVTTEDGVEITGSVDGEFLYTFIEG